ncbi:MAG: ferredoxin family protein [Bacillota bacterium]
MEAQPVVYQAEKGSFCLFPNLCKGCGLCIEKCPKHALSWSKVLGAYGTPAVEANQDCNICGICQRVCPDCAILVARKDGKEA